MTFLHNSKIISSKRPKINNTKLQPQTVKADQYLVFAPKFFIITNR